VDNLDLKLKDVVDKIAVEIKRNRIIFVVLNFPFIIPSIPDHFLLLTPDAFFQVLLLLASMNY